MQKENVKVKISNYGSVLTDAISVSLFLNKINGLLMLIPEEFRDTAIIEKECFHEYEDCDCFISISYYRPENDQELTERLAQKEFERRAEKELYEKLKAKYETISDHAIKSQAK